MKKLHLILSVILPALLIIHLVQAIITGGVENISWLYVICFTGGFIYNIDQYLKLNSNKSGNI